MSRKILPTLFISIDLWGKDLLDRLISNIDLLEPPLLHENWVSGIDVSDNSKTPDEKPADETDGFLSLQARGEILQKIKEKLAPSGNKSYEIAFSNSPIIHVILLGSISDTDPKELAKRMGIIRDFLKEKQFVNQIAFSSIVDGSDPDQHQLTPTLSETMPIFTKELEILAWNNRIYLFTSYKSDGNVANALRAQVKSAAQVFSESLIFCANWEGSGGDNILLPNIGITSCDAESDPSILSSVGCLLLCSAVPYVKDYLSQVSTSTLLEYSSIPDEKDKNIPNRLVINKDDFSIDSTKIPSPPNLKRLKLSVFRKTGEHKNTQFLNIFLPKYQITEMIQSHFSNFSQSYSIWWQKIKQEIPTITSLNSKKTLEWILNNRNEYEQFVISNNGSKFIYILSQFSRDLEVESPDSSIEKKDWAYMDFDDIGDIIEHPDFNLEQEFFNKKIRFDNDVKETLRKKWLKLKKSIAYFPNIRSWAIYSVLFFIFQLITTKKILIDLLGATKSWQILGIVVVVWIVVFGYLIYRIPSIFVQRNLNLLQQWLNQIVNQTHFQVEKNVVNLTSHWTSIGKLITNRLRQHFSSLLKQNIGFVMASGRSIQNRYPKDPYNQNNLKIIIDDRYIRLLDAPENWQNAINSLYIPPSEIANTLRKQTDFQKLWLDYRPNNVMDELERIIHRAYVAIEQKIPGHDPEKAITNVVDDWNDLLIPLLALSPHKGHVESPILHYACAAQYCDIIGNNFQGKLTKAKYTNLDIPSRIYFYNVMPVVKTTDTVYGNPGNVREEEK